MHVFHISSIYQKWFDHSGNTYKLQLIVPRSLIPDVLQQCHNTVFAGHQGIHKTKLRVKQHFYWYRMGEDIKSHIMGCSQCTANRHPKRKPRAALMDYRVGYSLDRIAVDILGPLPITDRGNNCILVIGDYFTRFMESYPLPDQKAETVAQTLVNEFICRYGAPLEINMDHGRNFQNAIFQQTCNLFGAKTTRSTPYHPSSNGLIERFNGTLAKMLRCFTAENPTQWDLYLPALTAAYRSTVHPATGFTPNQIMFGREVNTPFEMLFPKPRKEGMDIPEYVTNLKDEIENCYQLAREHLKSNM